jgi:RNA polymerase sigma-70 factor (ECF subfamily)
MPSEIEQLYREHRAGLVRLVERELHDHHDAEDVVQTAFLDAQRALERGTIPRNPRAWLAAIALNAAHRLRRRRLNAAPLEEYAVHEASRLPEIRAALASLPTAQRVAVLYRDVFGLSYGETAEQMGTSVNAVTMLLHRGRQRLRQTLAALTDGAGVWRWLQQGGASQVAVIKGAAAVAAAAGLTTAGVATARAVAPVGADVTAQPATRVGSLTAEAVHSVRTTAVLGSARRRAGATRDSRVSARRASPQGSPAATGSSPAAAQSSAAGAPSSTAEPPAASTAEFRLPAVSLPTTPVSSVAAAVPATVTVSTPAATVTVATPTGITATVSTPITTVTVPIP